MKRKRRRSARRRLGALYFHDVPSSAERKAIARRFAERGGDRAGAGVVNAYDIPPSNRLADAALAAAKAGDWRPLDDYIARGFPLPDALRQYFRYLLPFAPKPKQTPKLNSTRLRQLEIAAFIWKADQSGSRAPVKEAEKHFVGVSRSTIQKANAAFKKLDAHSQDLILQAIAGKQPEPSALHPFEDSVAALRLRRPGCK
jgi:hypothetical protein